MKIVKNEGRVYGVTVLELTAVPYEMEGGTVPEEDLIRGLYLMKGCSLELLRMADGSRGGAIRHILVLRCAGREERRVIQMAEELSGMVSGILQEHRYGLQERDAEAFMLDYENAYLGRSYAILRNVCTDRPGEVQMQPVAGLDLGALSAALAGSGCALSVQITPCAITAADEAGLQALRRTPGWEERAQLLRREAAAVTMTVRGRNARIVALQIAAAFNGSQGQTSLAVSDMPEDPRLWWLPGQSWRVGRWFDEKQSRVTGFFGGGLFNLWLSREQAVILALPKAGTGFVGVEDSVLSLLPTPSLLPDGLRLPGKDKLLLGHTEQQTPVYLDMLHVNRTVAIYGLNGTGKTSCLRNLFDQLHSAHVPGMVIAGAKKEWRSPVHTTSPRIYTPGNDAAPLQLNIFQIPRGLTLRQYKPCVTAALKASMSMVEPLPSLLEIAVDRAYQRFGYRPDSRWEQGMPFSLRQFADIYKTVIREETKYSDRVAGDIETIGDVRLNGLLSRAAEVVDTKYSSIEISDLLGKGVTVVELDALGVEEKKLVAFALLSAVQAYIKTLDDTAALSRPRSVVLIDEAHAFLDQEMGATQESQNAAQAIRTVMGDITSEFRSRGLGLIVSDQSPTRTGQIFDQAYVKILFQLEGTGAEMAASGLLLNDRQASALQRLNRGEAILKVGKTMIGLRTPRASFGAAVSDASLRQYVPEAGSDQAADRHAALVAQRLLAGGSFPGKRSLTQALEEERELGVVRSILSLLRQEAANHGVSIPAQYDRFEAEYIKMREQERWA